MKTLALTAIFSATLTAACSGSTAGQSTMELLKAGDAKICVAGNVEDALRALITPKGADAKNYSIAFDAATLESFDKTVTKATCHAALRISNGREDLIPATGLDFTIVPSAQDPSTFVVAAAVDPFKDRLAGAIANDEAHQEQDREREAESSRLAALVKPGWLIGRWVTTDQGSNACSEGPYSEFARSGQFSAGDVTGTWKLTNRELAVTGPGATILGTIGEADASTFTITDEDGKDAGFRRCTRQDMVEAQDPDADEGDESGIDAENPAPAQQ